MNNNSNQYQGNYDTQTDQTINRTSIQQPQNYKNRKKKYWLIPLFTFVIMIVSKIIEFVLLISGIKSQFANTFLNIIFIICGFAVVPTIIVAVILGTTKK